MTAGQMLMLFIGCALVIGFLFGMKAGELMAKKGKQ